ncbi:carboxymuconolactone decarboxylase family protein [Aliifodinibius sp. S!AR15-10]|uniref:carboxymuconolactone decarboxylase family protein n=1 Tax=Aliifodinibius sp. S!AR15-10 TaxID=2950437 RepID=UPI002864C85F|nr:carboxymuconolactone decarboxylase family protein [Aliifodinibius sp. S!AR15-10]MDR8391645.1 carboxymuconolactone decarboxylase family protein [Aliifodinibius sp. S!AR15-10]
MTDYKSDLPKPFENFNKNYPDVAKAYSQLGYNVHHAGPIDQKTRELIKLAISCGAQKEGAVHSHTKKALDAGATKEDIHHVVLLTLPTLGMPSMMAAMTWVDDILEE